ncbi:hypothetical protein CK203_035625 [Vitis vinifera]|uniref:BED-type domain-containing protein n=1 Tax=Vitis vinifera TaxID=29760 RepID=A0A438ICG0_VITVI|nr:hypothetical protein CK203_035625 [Vitis vinifera]
MASESGSSMPGRDPAWKYCSSIEGNRNGIICNFCGLVMKSGGITQFKFHLTHNDPHNNTKKCPRVPPEVKEEIRLLVHDKKKAKAKKNVDIEDIRAQLRGTMGTHHTHLVNEDDDDEDAEDEDVYMYPVDMHPDERDAYRSAFRASKASKWECEQHENIVGSKRKTGSLHGLLVYCRRCENHRGVAIKETMRHLISKLFIYENVAPAKPKSHHFKNMIISAQQAGMRIEPPSPYEIKNKYLEMEYKKWKLIWLLAPMRKYYGGDIVQPGATSCSHNAICVRAYTRDERKPYSSRSWRLDLQIIQDRWEKTLKHPLHAVGVELVVIRKLLQVVHDVFAKLDPTTESLGQFGNEMQKEDSVIKRQLQQAEWWFMCGNQTPKLRKLAIKVLSQTASSSTCERNWSTFALIHTKQRNRLAYPRLDQLVFCYYNMRLKLRDMEAKNDRVAKKDYLDLLDISAEAALNSHQEIDSTSVAIVVDLVLLQAFASGYDGSRGGTDDGGDNAGGDIDECQHSQYPISQFTCENDFTHCTQDEDHGSRRAGPSIGAIGKPYRGRKRMMEPYNEELLSRSFESMSIGTQFSDSSNEANVYPPHVMSYGQPSSSTDEEYGMPRYSPSRQMSYQVPY